jgi:hypothetical protein
MMPIDAALFHLHQKVANDPKSTANEIESINSLVHWISDYKKTTYKENVLFSKLYVVYLGALLDHYKDLDYAQKSIHKDLSEPIDFHYEFFKLKLNSLELQKFYKEKGISEQRWFEMSDKEWSEENDLAILNQNEFLEKSNKWSSEQVTEAFQNQITEAINRFKHYD